MFREFEQQIWELGPSQKHIMIFFQDLNLPMDEPEALGKEYGPKAREEVIQGASGRFALPNRFRAVRK